MKLTPTEIESYNEQRHPAAVGSLCWAPFKSMYFGFRGNVSVCCFNKTHVIGKYPKESIKSIWFGGKANEIRGTIKQQDFSLGCQGCHELISVENYNALPAKNFDDIPLNSAQYPTKIDFELSNECNLECVMCRGEFSSAIRKNREKLPPIYSVYDESFINQLEEFIPHIHHSHFLGGEPLMIPIYLDIWERMLILNPKIRISIQTNGTILTDRVKKILASMRFEIGVSIDSIEEVNYQIIRKNGNFNKVMANIWYFRNYCKENNSIFHISYCPMIQNWQELPDVISFVNELDCKVFFNTVSHPKDCSLASLGTRELAEIIDTLLESEFSEESEIQKENKKSYEGVISQLKHWKEESLIREKFNEKHIEVTDLTTYFQGLKSFIHEETTLPDKEREEVYVDIQSKLNYLIETAAEHGTKDVAIRHIIGMNYKVVLQNVPTSNREHLLYLFKSFIMPLPD